MSGPEARGPEDHDRATIHSPTSPRRTASRDAHGWERGTPVPLMGWGNTKKERDWSSRAPSIIAAGAPRRACEATGAPTGAPSSSGKNMIPGVATVRPRRGQGNGWQADWPGAGRRARLPAPPREGGRRCATRPRSASGRARRAGRGCRRSGARSERIARSSAAAVAWSPVTNASTACVAASPTSAVKARLSPSAGERGALGLGSCAASVAAPGAGESHHRVQVVEGIVARSSMRRPAFGQRLPAVADIDAAQLPDATAARFGRPCRARPRSRRRRSARRTSPAPRRSGPARAEQRQVPPVVHGEEAVARPVPCIRLEPRDAVVRRIAHLHGHAPPHARPRCRAAAARSPGRPVRSASA